MIAPKSAIAADYRRARKRTLAHFTEGGRSRPIAGIGNPESSALAIQHVQAWMPGRRRMGGALTPTNLFRQRVRAATDLAVFRAGQGEPEAAWRVIQPTYDSVVEGRHRVLLEGTKGTSLSLHHVQYPRVTARDTTVAGYLADADIAPSKAWRVIMICRM